MNSESGQRLGFDLNALDVVLDSFAQTATDPSTDRTQFYASINKKIVACTESKAAAILLKNREGQVRIANQAGWKELESSTRNELKSVVKHVFRDQSDTTQGKANLASFSKTLSNSTVFVSSCYPQNGMHFSFLLVRAKLDDEFAGQVFGDLANEVASQIEAFENVRSADQKPQSLLELTQIAQLVQHIGKSNSLAEMSFQLVNDLAKITKSDRVSYISNSGKIQAVSGVSKVSFRTSVARVLSKIARLSMSSGGSFEWTNDGELIVDGNRTPRGLRALVDELPSVAGFAIPIKSSGVSSGVLIVEYFDAESTNELERRELVNEAVNFASPVVSRAVQIYSIPAIGGLDVLFNRFLVKPIRVLCTLALTLAVIGICFYLLFGLQRPFEIYGEGALQTAEDRHVFAQIDGEVDEILVKEGSFVAKDQQLLSVKSESLAKELIAIEGEIEEAKQEMRNLQLADFRASNSESPQDDETKIASDVERLKIRQETLEAKREFFENKKKQLLINSPIAGQVTTPNLRQRLTDRPIDRGDLMMTISDTNGEWEIELQIADNRVEFVKQAQADSSEPLEVEFRLASDSQKTYSGKLSRLDFRSDTRNEEEKTMVMAYITIDEAELGESLRLGTRVYGKINCGQRHNFFLLTYEANHKIREWLFH